MRWFTLVLLVGCADWGHLPLVATYHSAPLWDGDSAVAATDGLYVPMPATGGLMRLTPDGATPIDLGVDGQVTHIELAPDNTTVLAFIDRYFCADTQGASGPVRTIEDCPSDLRIDTELTLIRDASPSLSIPIETAYNTVSYAPDGSAAVLHVDVEAGANLSGLVNLSSVLVVDLLGADAHPVAVGFAADDVLFLTDEDQATTGAVVLSLSEVAVLDLVSDPPVVDVTFPLTLDADDAITPVDIGLTPDSTYALISVEGRNDLYALDLVDHSPNILTLAAPPSGMQIEQTADRTVLVYGSEPVVQLVEHDLFDIETLPLEEPMTDITVGTGFAVLYNTGSQRDLYRLDLSTQELTEYRLQNSAVELHMAPDESFAIVFTEVGNDFTSPGMEVIDLLDDESIPYLLEGTGVGVAFVETDSGIETLILQSGVEYLFQLHQDGTVDELRLAPSPQRIGSLPDGTFFITHSSALGLVSFFDPSTDEIVEVGGFGGYGLAHETELLEAE